jgi:hypothetical protein
VLELISADGKEIRSKEFNAIVVVVKGANPDGV